MKIFEHDFDAYAFSKQSTYHEPNIRKEFAKAVPLRTVVVYCYDPRAVPVTSSQTNTETKRLRRPRFSKSSSQVVER